MSKIALPGLARVTSTENPDSLNMSLPANKNPFISVGEWTSEMLKQINIEIGDVKETTSDFTRKKNPGNRYWKALIFFKHKDYDSRIIKMNNCDVPYVKATNYGSDYIFAKLQKSVADAIANAALKQEIVTNTADKRIAADANNWWMTINNTAGRIGIIDSNGTFEPKDLSSVFQKTEAGVKLNLDLVFSLRLTVEGNRERTARDAFSIVPDCSRGAIKAAKVAIDPPSIDSAIPQQRASKDDIASQELIELLDNLIV